MSKLFRYTEDELLTARIKAVGEWELDVLGVPFGSPTDKDSDGEYFTALTDFHLQQYPTPALHYYHGYTPDGDPQGKPEKIGEVVNIERKDDGLWFRVALDRTSALAKRVMDAARQGLARASSGTIGHLWRKAIDGLITSWPLVELSLFDMSEAGHRAPANRHAVAVPVAKSLFEAAGITFPDDLPGDDEPKAGAKGEEHRAKAAHKDDQAIMNDEGNKMDKDKEKDGAVTKEELGEAVATALAGALKAQAEATAAKVAEDAAIQEKIDAAVEKAREEERAKFAEANRLPGWVDGDAPATLRYGQLARYDNLEAEDLAIMVGVLNTNHNDVPVKRASPDAVKSLALRLIEHKGALGAEGRRGLQRAGFKSLKTDEVMQQSLTGYGDEWVGVAYSRVLWEAIRGGSEIVSKLPTVEFEEGHESMVIPLEGADPTFYKVAETADHDGTSGYPVATVTSSKMATGQKSISLVKMGARVPFSGEMNEDSLIPFIAQLRAQMTEAGQEQFEHVIIDGDTETGATTNINDIGGTPGSTDAFLLVNGFRKSPLVTTVANARSGGTLEDTDFLKTAKLMGTAGMNAADITKCGFIIDGNTRWKALEITTVKTKDIFSNPTIENGKLVNIWGYPVFTSYNMHFKASDRQANDAGKVDQDTVANNDKGAILCVRWDQWLLGYRRRMTVETTRYAASDSSEIVMLMRFGLAQRDTEASAISYNITL